MSRQLAEKETNKIAFNNEGQTLEGNLIAINDKQFNGTDNNGNPKISEYKQYTLKQKDGKAIIFNGSTDLDAWFANIKIGQYVWITYVGKAGNNFKKFKVEFDPELPIIQVEQMEQVENEAMSNEGIDISEVI